LRILIHDFAGHPFQAHLSRELARRGYEVLHVHCGGVASGKGALTRRLGDPATLQFIDASVGSFERYSAPERLRAELRYGSSVAAIVRRSGPAVVISSNAPLFVQPRIWRAARAVGARKIYWLQDFLGLGTRGVLAGRSPILGLTAGAALERLETALLRRSDAIVAITEDFLPELQRRAITVPRVVIENWAPIDEITVRPKDNAVSRRLGVHNRCCALYSGTLGLKHDPMHLVRVAEQLAAIDAVLLVASEGLGRDLLEKAKTQGRLASLVLIDYVAYEELPDLLGSADACIVLLQPEAGTFSVPSKVLTYLAAGKPVIASVPGQNLAARVLRRSGAGVVTEPGEHGQLASAVSALLTDPDRLREMSIAARRYAEEAFDVVRIADEVVGIFAT